MSERTRQLISLYQICNKLIELHQICLLDSDLKLLVRVWIGWCLESDRKVLLDRNSDGPPVPVEQEDVLDVELGEEKSVILRPALHVRMTGKERLSGNGGLLRIRILTWYKHHLDISSCCFCICCTLTYLDHVPCEDDVSTPGVLIVPSLLPAVAGLGEADAQRGPGVLLKVHGWQLEGHVVDVGHAGAPLPPPVTHWKHVGERVAHYGDPRCYGGHGGPVCLVHQVAGVPVMDWVSINTMSHTHLASH